MIQVAFMSGTTAQEVAG